MKSAKSFFKWIKKNRKWLFSGIGITIISIIMSIINGKYSTDDEDYMPKEDNKIINYGENYGDIYQNVTIYNINDHNDSVTSDDSLEDIEENQLIQIEINDDEIEYENSIIEDLYLGESKEYIESIFGKPRFEFGDSELINSFYSLKYIVIRFVFDKNESLVGYFVTSKYKDSKIKIRGPLSNGEIIVIGENTFEPESYTEAVVSGGVGMGGMSAINTYYWEYSFMYGVGLYKTYVAAIFPYGFTESESYNLMSIAAMESAESQEIFNYREKLHPNTIGMMDSNYTETIKPYMANDDNYILWIECMMKLIKDVQ